MNKNFYRCTVCGDIHFGNSAPELCPTCKQLNKYVQIDEDEANKLMFGAKK